MSLLWKDFRYSLLVTVVCLGLAAWWGSHSEGGPLVAMWVTAVLAIMEVTLSFDNAVVNAEIGRAHV